MLLKMLSGMENSKQSSASQINVKMALVFVHLI